MYITFYTHFFSLFSVLNIFKRGKYYKKLNITYENDNIKFDSIKNNIKQTISDDKRSFLRLNDFKRGKYYKKLNITHENNNVKSHNTKNNLKCTISDDKRI